MSFLNSIFGGTATEGVQVLNPSEYKAAISNGAAQLVDVRSKGEFMGGHIKGAKNIDFFDQGSFKSKFEKLDKNKPLYIYCQSGNRSRSASKVLSQMGFSEIYDLRGGYMSWR